MRALTASLFLCASAMAAQIESNSVVSQAALGRLYDSSGAASVELVDSSEKPLWGVITSSFNLRSPLFLIGDELASRKFMIPAKGVPAELEGLIYLELKGDVCHRFKCVKAGGIAVLAPTAKAAEMADFLNPFSRLEGAVFKLSNGGEYAVYRCDAKRGEIFEIPAGAVLGGIAPRAKTMRGGETLYNGIVLPKQWPPHIDMHSNAPAEPPYLKNPPKVIDISVGRQLFFDDFLIEKTNLSREFHKPRKYEGNPILKPETALEKTSRFGNNPVAAPLSGSILWNPDEQIFQMWYEAGHVTSLAYAESKDGLHWSRPELDIEKGTNRVMPKEFEPDSWTVIRDYRAENPSEKFKMFFRSHDSNSIRADMFLSEDGRHWRAFPLKGLCGDRSTFSYNPFRKKWIASIRFWGSNRGSTGRHRAYYEADTFAEAVDWHPYEPVFWARADKLDKSEKWPKTGAQLYNLDCAPYESIMLGVFQIMTGPENGHWGKLGMPKSTGLCFAYSRDGFHWHRPDRTRVIDSEHKGTWDNGYIQSVSNVLCVMGDKLYFYYTGFAGDPSKTFESLKGMKNLGWRVGMYSGGATGVAFLRRDGFASMNSSGDGGELLTRALKFSGKHFFVNAEAKRGLRVQLETPDGKPIEPFTFENCAAFVGDSTIAEISWKGAENIGSLAGKPLRARFSLGKNAKLYSFWASRDKSGRSDGYVAGGGRGFTSDVDTVGVGSYK